MMKINSGDRVRYALHGCEPESGTIECMVRRSTGEVIEQATIEDLWAGRIEFELINRFNDSVICNTNQIISVNSILVHKAND